jgi:hypothetical protein
MQSVARNILPEESEVKFTTIIGVVKYKVVDPDPESGFKGGKEKQNKGKI